MRGLAALGDPNQALLDALISEMLIPNGGRPQDGVLAVTSTATFDPNTGASVPANTANGRDVWIGNRVFKGAALRADRATSGLFGAASSSSTLASNSTAAGFYPIERTFVEDSSNGLHLGLTANVAITDATNYTISTLVKRGSGSRNVFFALLVGGVGAGVFLDLFTGAIVNFTGGTGSVVRASARLQSNGFWFLQVTVSATTWGGSPQLQFWLRNANNTGTYTGDGTSSITVSGYLGELGDSASMPLNWDGGAASRVATLNSWNQSLGLTSATMFNLSMPYSRAGTVASTASPRLYEAITTGILQYDAAGQTYTAQRTDAIVNTRTVTSASTPAVAGSQKAVIQRWDAVSNRITVDGITVSSGAPTTPFAVGTPIIIGNRAALDQPYEGWDFNALFTTRAISERERIFLEANTRIV